VKLNIGNTNTDSDIVLKVSVSQQNIYKFRIYLLQFGKPIFMKRM
jgi:hypothetical protein